MRILRWISEHIINDNFLNDCIWEKVRVAPIEEKITEARLHGLNICKKKPPEILIRKIDQIIFSLIRRDRGR